MKATASLTVLIVGLLLALTALLVRGAAPDAPFHQRTMAALHDIVLEDAALQRDVLKARAGKLANYDSLVRAAARLRSETVGLREVSQIATGDAAVAIGRLYVALADAVTAQAAAAETFKSSNALLQNSLRYINHVSERLAGVLPEAPHPVTAEVATLAGGMLRLVTAPGVPEVEALNRSLERLARLADAPALQADLDGLVLHGRLVATTLPRVDSAAARVLATPIAESARALQADYLEHYALREAQAIWSQRLLYAAAVGLLAWLAFLVLRLRVSAQRLETRLRFETVVAGIAASFIDLPRERLGEGVTAALGNLAKQLGADRAEISFVREAPEHGRAFRWSDQPTHRPDHDALTEQPEHQSAQSRSRLRVRVQRGGANVGWLNFEATRRSRRWDMYDRALLQTAGEILAGAVERDRSAAEREALEAGLHEARRMEAVGRLAGGISHDFNNILGAILGYAEMAIEALPHGSRTWEHVRQVQIAGRRASDVVDQILAFSRRDDPELRPLRLHSVCTEAVGLLRASLPSSVSIQFHASPAGENAVVVGDTSRLQLVVLNLATNAAQAMDGQGVLTLNLDTVELKEALDFSHGALPAGSYVRLAVIDTGHGIDAATAQRVFEPFFTTKRAGRGTGLGLATTWNIITGLGGTVNLCSEPGEGSTFEIWLACISAAVEDAVSDPAPPLATGHGETVLLVDDERPLVALGEERLASLGYEPVGFASAPQALAAFRADPGRFDLALTDQVMPEMTGTQLATALHRIRPGLPVVLMTGFGGPVSTERLRAAGIAEVLRKPLTGRAIADTLARQLQAPRTRPQEPP